MPPFSLLDWDAAVNDTVGVASSSVIVAVWLIVPKAVALVGFPMSMTIVSSGSSIESLIRLIDNAVARFHGFDSDIRFGQHIFHAFGKGR